MTAEATSGNVNVMVPAGQLPGRRPTPVPATTEIVGIVNDPAAKNVINVRTGSGDVTISAA